MIVREVRLENIKSYGSPAEVIRFTRGVNAICGVNGSGKSTILEAIGCALFQHLPYSHDQFVREGESSGTITVVVESRFDGRVYEVVRRVGKNRPTQYVHDPELGQHVAQGESDVRRWLRQHLQLGDEVDLPSLFVDAVGPPQGTLTAPFLDGRPARAARFDRILRVQEYADAWAKLRNLDNALDDEKAALDVAIAGLQARVDPKRSIELLRDAKRAEQAELALTLSRCLAERDTLDRLLAEFRRGEAAWRQAQSDLSLAEEREGGIRERQQRAKRDFDASIAAAETRSRLATQKDEYLHAEQLLKSLEQEGRRRDALRRVESQRRLELSRREADLRQIESRIELARRAAAEAIELEARIPQQEAAEARLRAAREAITKAEEIRNNQQRIYALGKGLKERQEQRKAELARALELRPVAAELPGREADLAARVRDLEAATRADGQQSEIRRALQQDLRAQARGQARLAEIERELDQLQLQPELDQDAEQLQVALTEVVGKRAAAESNLDHARQTRAQVAGGLCPLLNEPCRNLRPGVTLEAHFDHEIERWSREVVLLSGRVGATNRALDAARAEERREQRVSDLEAERAKVATELSEVGAKVVEQKARLREAAALAMNLSTVREAEARARALVREAERAASQVARIPALEDEVAELETDLEARREEIRRDRARLEELKDAEAEEKAARDDLARIGSPRENATLLRRQAGELDVLEAERVRILPDLDRLHRELEQAVADLAPFADLDERLDAVRRQRDLNRPAYEEFLAAAPLAALSDERTEALHRADAELREAVSAREAARQRFEAAAAAYDEARHREAEGRRRDLDHKIGETRARIEAAAQDEAQQEEKLRAIAVLEVQLEELLQQVERLEDERRVAFALRNAIRAAGPEITRQLLSRISRTASRINSEILNQAGIELEWTPEYEIVTRRQGESRGFAQLSGGEQMAAALAVRLAVLRDLSNVRIAFLDEPTAHLDQERRSNLGDQVQRLQGFDQLVVISHDDTFDGLFGHVIRVSRQGDKSKVVDQS